MPTVTQPRLHHLALTVTDLDASVKWYETIFDVHFLMDVPHPGGKSSPIRTCSSCSRCTDTTPTTATSSPKPQQA